MFAWWKDEDCRLDEAGAAALVAEHFPESGLERLRYFDEGWDSWVYAARDQEGRDWMLRFPKRAGVGERLLRETRLLPELQGRLPLQVPDFRLIWSGEPGSAYPHPHVAYLRLGGRPLQSALLGGESRGGIAEDLGRVLGALHGFSTARAAALGVDDPEITPAGKLEDCLPRLEEFAAQIPAALRDGVARVVARPPVWSEAPCLIHADVFPEHVLVDAGRVTGLIDWGDVGLGDPAWDLSGICYGFGGDVLEEVLSAYVAAVPTGESVAALSGRARFYAVCRAVEDVAYGVTAGRDAYRDMGLMALRMVAG